MKMKNSERDEFQNKKLNVWVMFNKPFLKWNAVLVNLVTEERFHSNWLFTIHTKLRPVVCYRFQ